MIYILIISIFFLITFLLINRDKRKLSLNLLAFLLYFIFFQAIIENMIPQFEILWNIIPEVIVLILILNNIIADKFNITKIGIITFILIFISLISNLIILKIDIIQYIMSIRVYIRYILLYIVIKPILKSEDINRFKSIIFNCLVICIFSGIIQFCFREFYDFVFISNIIQPEKNSIFYISGTLGRYNTYGPLVAILFSYLDYNGYFEKKIKSKNKLLLMKLLIVMCIFASFSRLAWILILMYYFYKNLPKKNKARNILLYYIIFSGFIFIIIYILLGDIMTKFAFNVGENANLVDRIFEVININNYRLNYYNADGSQFRIWLLVMGTIHMIVDFPINLFWGFGAGSFWVKNDMLYEIAEKINFNAHNAIAMNDSGIFGVIGQYGVLFFIPLITIYILIFKESNKSRYIKFLVIVFFIFTIFFNIFESNSELIIIIIIILLENNFILAKSK